MLWPPHLEGVPPAGLDAVQQAADGLRREKRESSARIEFEVTDVLATDGKFFALKVLKLPERVGELEFGRIEIRALDLFQREASGVVVHVDEERRTLFARFDEGSPRAGRCWVYPFDHLESLCRFFELACTNDALGPMTSRALSAALGARPPCVVATGGPFDRLWAQSWGVVWGPPGTGKTTTLARELACRVHDGRTLFVSTTNQATDTAALRFGGFLSGLGSDVALGRRVGPGASAGAFATAELSAMLPGGRHDVRLALASLENAIEGVDDTESMNSHHARVQPLRQQLSAVPFDFLDPGVRTVFATVNSAAKLLGGREPWTDVRARIEGGRPPFDTVVIDEAGMVPRATVAMLSLLASRRVLLAGDPRQLAPMSRAARVFAPTVKRFVALSAVDDLRPPAPGVADDPSLLFLDVQHRSDLPIGELVSCYQYEGRVTTSPEASCRARVFPNLPSTAILVLDEEPSARRDPSRVHAERPTGGSGWQRPLSLVALGRLFDAFPGLSEGNGLFVSPFAAHRDELVQFVETRGLHGRFRASTVHAQQGSEADIVVFDPVHAGSTAWDEIGWRRLVNVALSRARSCAILIASRDELSQPFLSPLIEWMPPHRLARGRLTALSRDELVAAGLAVRHDVRHVAESIERYTPVKASTFAYRLGHQIGSRRRLRPVLGLEQDRLCRMRLDEGPRLVRGVAGSGKTLVAVRWAIRSLVTAGANARFLFVYGNHALATLIRRSLAEAAAELGFAWPDARLIVRHAGDVLAKLAPELQVPTWEYERLAEAIAPRIITPCFDALFIDEAQDFGEAALLQLFRVVHERADEAGIPRKALRIFYDDAQQVYGRARPNWAKLGVDLRGRSVVMRESFRSTRAIGEMAMNVLAELEGKLGDGIAELVDDQLVTIETHEGRRLIRSLHHLFEGPPPSLNVHASRAEEWEWVADAIKRALVEQDVRPGDIKVLAMRESVRSEVFGRLSETLRGICPVRSLPRGESPSAVAGVEILTPHAMKGYEAELIFVVAADTYCAKDEPLPRVLYTAMTRARSMLFITGTRGVSGTAGDKIVEGLMAVRSRLYEKGEPFLSLTGSDRSQNLDRPLGAP